MKKKNKIILLLMMLLLVMMVPVKANAAFSVKRTGVTYPTTLKYGSSFDVKGTLKSSQKIAKVTVTIYKGETCLQRYTATPNATTFDLAKADAKMVFNKLPASTYYYRISAWNAKGEKQRVLDQKFTVIGTGKIKIVNPRPSKDITIKRNAGYTIGGTITSTYAIKSITAKIVNSSNKALYTKTVKPSTKSYSLTNNKTLDNAMKFDQLSPGIYTFSVSVTDSQGTTGLVIKRKITVSGTTVSTNGTGSSGSSSGGSYTASGTVKTPAGFTARTTRPAASNKYYYNGTNNIYYKYNSLAPTGKVYYGSSYVTGNCTWYACGRAMEIVAKAGGKISNVQAIFGGDPVGIYQQNVRLKKFKYGLTPKIGSLVIFNYGGSTGDAHIAVVEKIVNGVPYVSESGYKVSTTKPNAAKSNIVFKYQSIKNWSGGRKILGYIYLV